MRLRSREPVVTVMWCVVVAIAILGIVVAVLTST
jgi:hypothetical protein